MDICQLIKEQEIAKSNFEKLKYKLIDLNYDIDNYCESKIGYVVEQFGEIYYIKKYKDRIFLGHRIIRKDNRFSAHKTALEIIFPDKCKYLGKGEVIGNKVIYKKFN